MYTGNLVSVGEKKNLGRFWSPLVLAYPIWCQLNKVLVKYSVFQKWHCTNKDQHYLARKQNPILKFYKIGIAELDQKNLLPLFCSLRNEKPRWYSKKFCIFSKFAKKKKIFTETGMAYTMWCRSMYKMHKYRALQFAWHVVGVINQNSFAFIIAPSYSGHGSIVAYD